MRPTQQPCATLRFRWRDTLRIDNARPFFVGPLHAIDAGSDRFNNLARFTFPREFVINFEPANGLSFGLRHAFQRTQNGPETSL